MVKVCQLDMFTDRFSEFTSRDGNKQVHLAMSEVDEKEINVIGNKRLPIINFEYTVYIFFGSNY